MNFTAFLKAVFVNMKETWLTYRTLLGSFSGAY